MAYNNFSFDPEAGFLDSGFYEDTPSNPREILQRQHNQTKDFINSLVNTLNSRKEGSSGSESIMSPEIEGVAGENVYEQIKDVKRQINDAAEGVIPDSSVTEEKLSDGAVSENKLKDGSIATEKFNENAIAPYANEALNINGIKNTDYVPLHKTGLSGIFKELVCKEKLTDISGKIYNGKKYMVINNLLYTLDLETGELSKYCDMTFSRFSKMAIYDENTIYFASLAEKSSDDYAYLSVYRYEKEYNELLFINEIKLFYAFFGSYNFTDIDVSETHLLVGIGRTQSSTDYNYFYKIPLSDLETITESEIYYSFTASDKAKSFFLFKDDVYFGTHIFKNAQTEEILSLYAEIKGCDSFGNILTHNSRLPIADKETLLPKCADIYSMSSSFEGFIYNNYYYVLVDGYLFKARLS